MTNRKKVITNTVVHVPLNQEQKQRLAEMAEVDHRKQTDFVRLLIDQEWIRRKKAEQVQLPTAV